MCPNDPGNGIEVLGFDVGRFWNVVLQELTSKVCRCLYNTFVQRAALFAPHPLDPTFPRQCVMVVFIDVLLENVWGNLWLQRPWGSEGSANHNWGMVRYSWFVQVLGVLLHCVSPPTMLKYIGRYVCKNSIEYVSCIRANVISRRHSGLNLSKFPKRVNKFSISSRSKYASHSPLPWECYNG